MYFDAFYVTISSIKKCIKDILSIDALATKGCIYIYCTNQDIIPFNKLIKYNIDIHINVSDKLQRVDDYISDNMEYYNTIDEFLDANIELLYDEVLCRDIIQLIHDGLHGILLIITDNISPLACTMINSIIGSLFWTEIDTYCETNRLTNESYTNRDSNESIVSELYFGESIRLNLFDMIDSLLSYIDVTGRHSGIVDIKLLSARINDNISDKSVLYQLYDLLDTMVYEMTERDSINCRDNIMNMIPDEINIYKLKRYDVSQLIALYLYSIYKVKYRENIELLYEPIWGNYDETKNRT